VPVRAILDANVYISYLLKSDAEGTVAQILERLFVQQFRLIVPDQVVAELKAVVERKPYLSRRIPMSVVDLLMDRIRQIAESPRDSQISQAIFVRDPDDMYLLEAAVDSDADFLVTRDKDLLALASHLQRPKIVTPFQFLAFLQS
jgi:putative PIN family toxin of toxin-antitoxin system